MGMAKKKIRRWKTKFIADCYHYLVEEETDKKNYRLGDCVFDRVWTTFYDCYIIVHCQYNPREKCKVTFAKKGHDFVYVTSRWVEANEE